MGHPALPDTFCQMFYRIHHNRTTYRRAGCPHPAAALRIAQKIPFSVEKGIFFLFREVFLNQLTRILNAARTGAPYIAVGYALEVAAQIRAVLLLELLLEHFRDLISLTLGRARLIQSCAVLHAREHERTAQRAAHLHAAHAEAEAFRHFIGGLLIQTSQIAVRADHRLRAVVALIVKILCQFCPFCHNKYLLLLKQTAPERRGVASLILHLREIIQDRIALCTRLLLPVLLTVDELLVLLVINEAEFARQRRNIQRRCCTVGVIIIAVAALAEHDLANRNTQLFVLVEQRLRQNFGRAAVLVRNLRQNFRITAKKLELF